MLVNFDLLVQSAQDTSGLPLDEPVLSKTEKLRILLSSRPPEFADEFFRDLHQRDIEYRSLPWRDITTHLERTDRRRNLSRLPADPAPIVATPQTTPPQPRPQAKPADDGSAFCALHGYKQGGHSTEACFVAGVDPKACEILRKHNAGYC